MMLCYAMRALGAEFLFLCFAALCFEERERRGEGREEAGYISSIAHEPVPPSMPLLRRSRSSC